MKVKIPCEIISKRKSSWFIFARLYVTLKPEAVLADTPIEIQVNENAFYDFTVGETFLVSFEKTPRDTYRLIRI